MANSRACPPDFVPGLSSADALNQLPRGCIGQLRRSSDSTNTATIQAVASTDTLTLQGGRRYRIEASVLIRSDIPGGVQVALHMNGSQIQRLNDAAAFANKDLAYTIITEVEPADGDYDFDLMVGVSGSDGNEVQSRADGPAGVDGETVGYVTDVGPAYE